MQPTQESDTADFATLVAEMIMAKKNNKS